MRAYYNENHLPTAYWLRELIDRGLLPPGDVDTRSIEDVTPADLAGYTQCHFFAGIGGWPLALRLAGFPDDEPIWTGSCPCQPFSAAGEGAGFDDERHLWPHFQWLIEQCRPERILGEQVASSDADPWIELVQADLEGLAYAFGAVAYPAAGVGAPHVRDRYYWVAHSDDARSQGRVLLPERPALRAAWASRLDGGLADFESVGRGQGGADDGRGAEGTGAEGLAAGPDWSGGIDGLADAGSDRREVAVQHDGRGATAAGQRQADVAGGLGVIDGTDPCNGYWRGADWIACQDGRWRPVEPGTFPLASGIPERVVRLRGYGNAINVRAAIEFIDALRD